MNNLSSKSTPKFKFKKSKNVDLENEISTLNLNNQNLNDKKGLVGSKTGFKMSRSTELAGRLFCCFGKFDDKTVESLEKSKFINERSNWDKLLNTIFSQNSPTVRNKFEFNQPAFLPENWLSPILKHCMSVSEINTHAKFNEEEIKKFDHLATLAKRKLEIKHGIRKSSHQVNNSEINISDIFEFKKDIHNAMNFLKYRKYSENVSSYKIPAGDIRSSRITGRKYLEYLSKDERLIGGNKKFSNVKDIIDNHFLSKNNSLSYIEFEMLAERLRPVMASAYESEDFLCELESIASDALQSCRDTADFCISKMEDANLLFRLENADCNEFKLLKHGVSLFMLDQVRKEVGIETSKRTPGKPDKQGLCAYLDAQYFLQNELQLPHKVFQPLYKNEGFMTKELANKIGGKIKNAASEKDGGNIIQFLSQWDPWVKNIKEMPDFKYHSSNILNASQNALERLEKDRLGHPEVADLDDRTFEYIKDSIGLNYYKSIEKLIKLKTNKLIENIQISVLIDEKSGKSLFEAVNENQLNSLENEISSSRNWPENFQSIDNENIKRALENSISDIKEIERNEFLSRLTNFQGESPDLIKEINHFGLMLKEHSNILSEHSSFIFEQSLIIKEINEKMLACKLDDTAINNITDFPRAPHVQSYQRTFLKAMGMLYTTTQMVSSGRIQLQEPSVLAALKTASSFLAVPIAGSAATGVLSLISGLLKYRTTNIATRTQNNLPFEPIFISVIREVAKVVCSDKAFQDEMENIANEPGSSKRAGSEVDNRVNGDVKRIAEELGKRESSDALKIANNALDKDNLKPMVQWMAKIITGRHIEV